MSYKLDNPYTEDEKRNFIVKYSHGLGLRIAYTANAIYALEDYEDLVGEEVITNHEYIVQKEKAAKRQEILKQLDSLDIKSIRAIRAGETEYIALYEEEAKKLRKQLQEL